MIFRQWGVTPMVQDDNLEVFRESSKKLLPNLSKACLFIYSRQAHNRIVCIHKTEITPCFMHMLHDSDTCTHTRLSQPSQNGLCLIKVDFNKANICSVGGGGKVHSEDPKKCNPEDIFTTACAKQSFPHCCLHSPFR